MLFLFPEIYKSVIRSFSVLVKRCFFLIIIIFLKTSLGYSQSPFAVSRIITDFGGFWEATTATATTNPVLPDNSHNLLAFTHKNPITNQNVTYSTGVNNSALDQRNIIYQRGDYRAITVEEKNLGTPDGETKIALGQLYDNVPGGPKNPLPAREEMAPYLTDGPRGLNLGTGVANLPAGTIQFNAKNIVFGAVNDNVPDIVITQIASPSTSTTSGDTYRFYDAAGNQVGNPVTIIFGSTTSTTSIPSVGQWRADFYEASQNPMTLGIGFTNTVRPLRLWAADFSSFGINATNYASVDNFRITLSGSSDLAFVAYNAAAFDIPLPITLTSFDGKLINGQAQLSWQTANETQNKQFVIEASTDAKVFTPVDSINGAGNTSKNQNYSYTDKRRYAGPVYYRLKQVDYTGKYSYSQIISINFKKHLEGITVFPNPSINNSIIIAHKQATGNEKIQLLDINGRQMLLQQVKAGTTETHLETRNLSKGVYQIVWVSTSGKVTEKLLIQ